MEINAKDLKVCKGKDYNYIFNKVTGDFYRWGKTKEDNPDFSPVGPEILDIEISTICDQGCSFCVPPGTKILTPQGPIPIEDIKIKDTVYGYNNNRKEQTTNQIFQRDYDGELIVIELQNETLKLTPNHQVQTQRGWVKAEKLTENDEIICF